LIDLHKNTNFHSLHDWSDSSHFETTRVCVL